MTIDDAIARATCERMEGSPRVLLHGMRQAASTLAGEVGRLRRKIGCMARWADLSDGTVPLEALHHIDRLCRESLTTDH